MGEPGQNPRESITDEEKWEMLTRAERLGELLLKNGKLTLAQLEELVKEQESCAMPFGELVIAKGIMSRHDLIATLDRQHKSDQVIIDSLTELINKHKEDT